MSRSWPLIQLLCTTAYLSAKSTCSCRAVPSTGTTSARPVADRTGPQANCWLQDESKEASAQRVWVLFKITA